MSTSNPAPAACHCPLPGSATLFPLFDAPSDAGDCRCAAIRHNPAAHHARCIPRSPSRRRPAFFRNLALEGGPGDGRAAVKAITGAETWPDFHPTQGHSKPRSPDSAVHPGGRRARLLSDVRGAVRQGSMGDKTPTYGTAIDQDRRASARGAHSPYHSRRRDVMLSVRGLWFRPGDTVEPGRRDWARRLARTREIGDQLPQYFEVRYEALVTSRPSNDLWRARSRVRPRDAALSRARGIAPQSTRPARRRRPSRDLESGPPAQPALRDGAAAAGSHRPMARGATADELRRFEAVAGEWLDLGYDRRS